jgi:hypothetical protein
LKAPTFVQQAAAVAAASSRFEAALLTAVLKSDHLRDQAHAHISLTQSLCLLSI